MRILVACEFSGTIREAFRARGHYAVSCDLLPAADKSLYHYQCDIREWLDAGFWDLMIAHPPCTYLCSSGLHWNTRTVGRAAMTQQALAFVRDLWNAPIPRICIENPQGCISTQIAPVTQYIQPYDFGEDASKKTGLWLKNLPPLRGTKRITGRRVRGAERWSNQTDSGQNRLTPSDDRWALRSFTYPGIARAMADQWNYLHGT
jgi:hypothetical protein